MSIWKGTPEGQQFDQTYEDAEKRLLEAIIDKAVADETTRMSDLLHEIRDWLEQGSLSKYDPIYEKIVGLVGNGACPEKS